MSQGNQILVATPSLDDAGAAIRAALRIANPLGATVHLLHIERAERMGPVVLKRAGVPNEGPAKATPLREMVTTANHRWQFEVVQTVNPATAIIAILRRGSHDTVILAGFRDEVADTVTRQAACPVLVPRTGGPQRFFRPQLTG